MMRYSQNAEGLIQQQCAVTPTFYLTSDIARLSTLFGFCKHVFLETCLLALSLYGRSLVDKDGQMGSLGRKKQ